MHRIGHRVRTAAIAIAFVALCVAPASASALDTASRPADAIRARWAQLRPVFVGSPYVVSPGTSAPYQTGTLAPGFLQDGLNAVNYARFLAGLPDDVTLDVDYTNRAQHGAVLLSASTFSHTPPKPADMDTAFYDLGYGATSRSNIGWGHSSLAQFNTSCIDDSDSSNIDRLGHRRWLLDPPLKRTGMGYAASFSDTFVFDWSRTPALTDYDYVAWPCAGSFPVEMLDAGTAWSVTLDPAKYAWTTGTTGKSVTLRRQRDGATWVFTGADTDKGGKYFNFETSGYGVANCFVFRPDPATLGGYGVGDTFDVTISGVTLKSSGLPAAINYRTELISHEPLPTPDAQAPVTASDAVATYAGGAVVRLWASDAGGSGVAHTYWSLDGGAVTEGSTVATSALGVHTLEFWSVDGAGNEETPHNTTTFEVTRVVQVPAAVTIRRSASSVRAGRAVTLSGIVVPAGLAGAPVRVYVRRPYSKRWVLLTTRAVAGDGSGRWSYRYVMRRSLRRGYYRFKAVLPAGPGNLAATSGSVTVRLR